MEAQKNVSHLLLFLQDVPMRWQDWIQLAQAIGITDGQIISMRIGFLNNFDLAYLIQSIILAWIDSQDPKNATLNKLLPFMKLHGLKNAAEKLEKHYSKDLIDSPIDRIETFQALILHKDKQRGASQLGTGGKIFYFEDRRIGHGATANVYEGFFEVPHVPAAVKIMDEEFTDIHLNEIEILRQAVHPNIVRYFITDTRKVHQRTTHYIAMELGIGTLEDVVDKHYKDCPPEDQAIMLRNLQLVCHHASEGLKWLHSKKILHRDIKPSNVLLFPYNVNGTVETVAKLGDFGISRKAISIIEGTDSMGRGTLDWMAPEALENKNKNDGSKFKTTYGVDIFSLGVTIFWSITLGKHPFGGIVFRYANVLQNPPDWTLINNTGSLKDELKHLLDIMLQKDPALRPSVDKVVTHPTFWDYNQKLEFVHQISNTYVIEHHKRFDLESKRIHMKRKAIDSAYLKKSGGSFNWKNKLCNVVKSYINSKDQSKYRYDGESVMDLLKFIRDKHEHNNSWPSSLKGDDVFGPNLPKVTNLYISYFLNKFPDIIVFLFSFLENNLEFSQQQTNQANIKNISKVLGN